MKYYSIIYSLQVPEKFKTYENTTFLHITPWKTVLQKNPILMHFVASISIQL